MKVGLVLFKEKLWKPFGRELSWVAEEMGIPIYDIDEELPDDLDWILLFYNNDYHTNADVKIAWWMCDYRDPGRYRRDVDPDVIFLPCKDLLKKYEDAYEAKAYYMPQTGIMGEIEEGRPVNWDAIFIGRVASTGGLHKHRLPILNKISYNLKTCVIDGEEFTEDQGWFYRETDFSLSISPRKRGYTSNRLYNILASGGFCLSLYFPGIEDLFENHKHLVWFETPDEAIEIMKEYQEGPEEIDRIKENALKIYEEKHTPRHRLENILDILKGKENEFRGYL